MKCIGCGIEVSPYNVHNEDAFRLHKDGSVDRGPLCASSPLSCPSDAAELLVPNNDGPVCCIADKDATHLLQLHSAEHVWTLYLCPFHGSPEVAVAFMASLAALREAR